MIPSNVLFLRRNSHSIGWTKDARVILSSSLSIDPIFLPFLFQSFQSHSLSFHIPYQLLVRALALFRLTYHTKKQSTTNNTPTTVATAATIAD